VISGTVYGVVLNDRAERDALAAAFGTAPYQRAPVTPVLYIKPRNCIAPHGAIVALAEDAVLVEVAATIGLLFGRDASRVSPKDALDAVAGACLAVDVTVPHDSYYRPPVRHRARDGFLPLGVPGRFDPALLERDIVTFVDDREAHRWQCTRLVFSAAELVAEISSFMTLRAGDLLLIGLPGDAPRIGAGERLRAELDGLAPVEARFVAETVA